MSLASVSGTDGSNPVPSSGENVPRFRERDRWFESGSLQQTVCLSAASAFEGPEPPRIPRGCARLAWRLGRQRRAGCFDTAATGGNISVAPYSSTAVPLTGSVGMPRWSQRSRSLLRA